MTSTLILMRHGLSQWNLENRFTGFTDVPLTEEGREEARKGGRALAEAGLSIDKVYTSTLKRAYTTAELALEASGSAADKVRNADGSFNLTKHDDLRERDYGDLTGLNKDDTREKYGEEQVHIWRRSYDVPPPGGECLEDVVEKRVRPYFEAEIKPHLDAGETVLIAAHGNSLRAMLIILGAETPDTINEAEMPTGAPLVFELDGDKIVSRKFL
ncbi:MAG: 2,3-diphosphoglycerate-dependent phosphoglycerate mutase [Pseudobdellovibrionaceae bacterium]